MVVCPCPTIGKVASGMRAVPPERLDSSTATAAGGANQAEQPAPDAAVNVSRSDTNMRDDASGGPRRPARRADSTDAVASFLSRRFGLAGGLAWLGQELGWYRSGPQASQLLDLLQSPPPQPPASRSAPRPPLLISWHSPLAQPCPAVDPRLRRHLQKLASGLPRRTFRIRTEPSNYGER